MPKMRRLTLTLLMALVHILTAGKIQAFTKNTTEDINGLSPSDYTVTVTSYAGCATSATYTITQPDQLQATVIDDEMYCKNTTTTVHVTATGGTLPYIGTGDMAGISTGTATFTVTDANGCTDTRSTYVNNGVNVAPGKPGTISSPDADATGLCAGGDFSYSIAAVSTATSTHGHYQADAVLLLQQVTAQE